MYALPELPYGYDALEPHVSRELLELHHGAHHAAYVKGANETLDKLEDARRERAFEHIGQLEKSLAFNVSGHVLHSLLWKNLTPGGGDTPTGELSTALKQDFGSFDAFKEQLTAAAASVQGSGWGALRGSRSASGCSSSRCSTTKATRAMPRYRSSSSTCGSTPTTCSTATRRRPGSKRSGSS